MTGSSARSGRRCSRVAAAGPADPADGHPRHSGVTVKRVEAQPKRMEGADRFMFYGLVLVVLLIIVGFVIALLAG